MKIYLTILLILFSHLVCYAKEFIIKDGNVYWTQLHGTKETLLKGADTKTFKILKHKTFAKDTKACYYKAVLIKEADPKSFDSITEYFAKDAIHVYFMFHIIEGADGGSYKLIWGDWGKDKNHCFDQMRMVEGADPKTFKIKRSNCTSWAWDKNGYYYGSKKVPVADLSSFKILGHSGFAKDKVNVYYENNILKGADAGTFHMLERRTVYDSFIGKDKNNFYSYGEVFKPSENFIREYQLKKKNNTPKRMPVYITPFYDSKGLKIKVGKYSKELSTDDVNSIKKTIAEMKKEWNTLKPEEMYVVAIRLYDLGSKDEAVYWFYSAQFRARLFQGLLDPKHVGSIGSKPFELIAAYNSFHQLSGEYINGYAFGDPEKLIEILKNVKSEGKKLPDFKKIYTDIAFINENKWPKINEKVGAGLSKFSDYLKKNKKYILEQREANGIKGRY